MIYNSGCSINIYIFFPVIIIHHLSLKAFILNQKKKKSLKAQSLNLQKIKKLLAHAVSFSSCLILVVHLIKKNIFLLSMRGTIESIWPKSENGSLSQSHTFQPKFQREYIGLNFITIHKFLVSVVCH